VKKVLIIGASGSLATEVIAAIKHEQLTLFVRNKNRLSSKLSNGHTIIEGDAMNFDSVKKAIAGQEIVYVNLAGNLEAMTKNIVNAMIETGVKRIIAVSSIGIYNEPLKPVLTPYRKVADVIEASGLEYTILRPDWFTNADEIDYSITYKGEPEAGGPVSRKSIADFIAGIIYNPDLFKNQNVGISKPA
jgi:uncharacterized protein YbjT (DUF2867 family)